MLLRLSSDTGVQGMESFANCQVLQVDCRRIRS